MQPAGSRQTCGACGLADQQPFEACAACGAEVFASSRRVVTAVFADLVGYTAMCSTMDVEDVHLVVRPLMNTLRGVFEDRGAVVPVIEGDGFMAVFGARKARDDDPLRAVAAAVAAQHLVEERRGKSGGVVPPLRVGIAMGEALVVPSWETAGFSVTGDCINVASRLCGAAAPGGVLAHLDVARAVPEGRWLAPTPLSLRNRDQAVSVQSLDVRHPLPVDQANVSASTPYVARPEDEALDEAIEHGAVLAIVGDAGLGKTRALEEAVARSGRSTVLWASAPSFAGDSLLKQLALQVPLGSVSVPDARRLRRLAGGRLATTEIDTEEECLEAVLEGLRTLRDAVVVLDDLQWADPLDAELVVRLSAARGEGTAVLLASRTRLEARVPVLALEPLRPEEAERLLACLLPGPTPELVESLQRRCGGVPLFIEQCVRLLLEQGVVRCDGPRTLVLRPEGLGQLPVVMRLFVASRLDALDPVAHGVLSAAAVIGDVVDVELLRYLSGLSNAVGDVVARLVSRNLLSWTVNAEGDRVLGFHHAVVREVAYESLLRARRVEMHRAAAEWYAVLPVAGQLEDEARHLRAAVELGNPDCELVRRAVVVNAYLALAVVEERPSIADSALKTALTLVEAHPSCDIDVLDVRLGQALLAMKQGHEHESLGYALEAIQLAERTARKSQLAMAQLIEGRARGYADPEGAYAAFDRAHETFQALDDRAGTARVLMERGKLDTSRGLVARIAAHEEAWSLAQRTGDQRIASHAAQDLATHLPSVDIERALLWRTRAGEAMRGDDVIGALRMQFVDGLVARLQGRRGTACTVLLDVFRQAQRSRDQHLELNVGLMAAEELIAEGRLADADEVLEHLRALAETRPTQRLAVDLAMHEALLEARSGQPGRAVTALRDLASASVPLGRDYERQARAFAAQVLADSGHFEPAVELILQALDDDDALDQPVHGLRLRVLLTCVQTAGQLPARLRDEQRLRAAIRASAADGLAAVARRWQAQAELLAGHVTGIELPEPHPGLVECHALDLENSVLRGADAALLLDAAEAWSRLGATVWSVRSLIWHQALTGTPHPEARAALTELSAPAGLEERFALQVAGLRG